MSEESDRRELVELIHRNRIAIWTKDYDTWDDCFVHAPYTARFGYWDQGGIFFRMGWDDIAARARIGGPPYSAPHAFDTRVENLNLRIIGDMAWATFDQIYPGSYPTNNYAGSGLVREMRVFERHGGKWKIALLGFLDTNTGRTNTVMVGLDPEARVLWQSPAAEATLPDSDDLAVRAGRLRFRDARLHRQLLDHLQWATQLDTTLMSQRGSRPIVADAGDGLAMRIYWLVADAGEIHLRLASESVSEERLSLAGAIYGLSPAQLKLAALVAEGLTLADIGERMDITANTARTHLNRIFEKTGVHTQPALVRVLLSAVAPI